MKIKEISILCRDGLYQKFTVGEMGVTDIINFSQEYTDHSEYVYEIKSENKPLFSIVNVPVLIEYE